MLESTLKQKKALQVFHELKISSGIFPTVNFQSVNIVNGLLVLSGPSIRIKAIVLVGRLP